MSPTPATGIARHSPTHGSQLGGEDAEVKKAAGLGYPFPAPAAGLAAAHRSAARLNGARSAAQWDKEDCEELDDRIAVGVGHLGRRRAPTECQAAAEQSRRDQDGRAAARQISRHATSFVQRVTAGAPTTRRPPTEPE
ncbi:hypothetical protein GCM10023094_39470 [Rhodococcus olei]|uniref:Uncharacterized protein n=1 Tax=Rhodococcus olei TaxID=2161675 RepID=A0ABP8PE31_9NOCA